MEFSRELFNEGVFAQGIARATVAEGKARLRTIMTATHSKDQLSKSRCDGILGILRGPKRAPQNDKRLRASIAARGLFTRRWDISKMPGVRQSH